jgi:hypothetical protein
MPNRPARHSQADLNRAIKAATKIDRPCAIEAKPDGTIRIIIGYAAETSPTQPIQKDWSL